MTNERLYSIHLRFDDGNNAIVYRDRTILNISYILGEWSAYYVILANYDDGDILDGYWHFYAKSRNDNGLSWPEFKETAYRYLLGKYEGEELKNEQDI